MFDPSQDGCGFAATVKWVRSWHARSEETAAKRHDYFTAGVQLVWEIDPAARLARVYESATQVVTLTAAETLNGDPVLPGFTVPLRELFAELDRHG